MLLSQTSEYAIRAVSYIALKEERSGALRARDISDGVSVPAHYLSKVLRRLVSAELLVAIKGHNGGFRLARPANKIRIFDIIAAVEAAAPIKHCIFGWRSCNSEEPCILHHRWSSVSDAFQKWARTTTLADIRHDVDRERWLTTFKDPALSRKRRS